MPDYEVVDSKGRKHRVRLDKEPTDAERQEIERELSALPGEGEKPAPRVAFRPGTGRQANTKVTGQDIVAGLGPAAKRLGQGLLEYADAGVGFAADSVKSLFAPRGTYTSRLQQEGDILGRGLIPFPDVLEAGLSPKPYKGSVFEDRFQKDPGGTVLDAALLAAPGVMKRTGAGAKVAAALQKFESKGVGGGRTLTISDLERLPDEGYQPMLSRPSMPDVELTPTRAAFREAQRGREEGLTTLARRARQGLDENGLAIGEGEPMATVKPDRSHVDAMAKILDESAPRRAMDSRSATPNELLKAIDGMEGIDEGTRRSLRKQLLKGQVTPEFYDAMDVAMGLKPKPITMPASEGGAGLMSLAPDEVKAWEDLSDETKWAIDLGADPRGAELMGERSFGGVNAKRQRMRTDPMTSLIRQGLDIANVPRSLSYSGDLNPALRQGGVLGAGNPKLVLGAARASLQAALSEAGAVRLTDDLQARPNAPLYRQLGLQVQESAQPNNELFRSSAAEKIPGIGRVVKASDRSYSAYLSRLRADAFDGVVEKWRKGGIEPSTHPRQYKALADWINTASGYGDLGLFDPVKGEALIRSKGLKGKSADVVKAMGKMGVVMNELGASPRNQAAKINMVRTLVDPRVPVEVRKIAAKDMGAHLAMVSSVVGAAAAMGYKVETRPDHTNFGKIEVSGENGTKTYLDLWGGAQPWARLVAQEAMGTKNGKPADRGELLAKRLEAVLAPTPSYLLEARRGTTYSGEKFDAVEGFKQRMWPLAWQDLSASIRAHGAGQGILFGGLAQVGGGVQNYKNDREKREARY